MVIWFPLEGDWFRSFLNTFRSCVFKMEFKMAKLQEFCGSTSINSFLARFAMQLLVWKESFTCDNVLKFPCWKIYTEKHLSSSPDLKKVEYLKVWKTKSAFYTGIRDLAFFSSVFCLNVFQVKTLGKIIVASLLRAKRNKEGISESISWVAKITPNNRRLSRGLYQRLNNLKKLD